METNEKITILIADDHTLMREALCMTMNNNSQFKVVGQCGTGEEGVALAQKLLPNLVLMDVNLPGIDGMEATREIRRLSPASKILGVSLHSEPVYARKMLLAGASGYISKTSHHEEMMEAISDILAGKKYICKQVKNKLADMVFNGEEEEQGIKLLSRRELEIIEKIKIGDSSKEIATGLAISVRTVEVHRHNIFKKLKMKNSVSLINYMNNHQLA